MVSKLDFHEFVETLITDEDREKIRKAKTKLAIILAVVLFIEAAGFLTFTLLVKGQMTKIVLSIFMVIIMIISTLIVCHNHSFKWDEFKEKNMPKVLGFLLNGYKYDYSLKNHIPEDVYKSSPFSSDYDDYKGEDLLSINVPNDDDTPSNTWFHISDLYITKEEEREHYVVDKYGNSHREVEHYTVTVFKGAFAHIDFPTMFKCKISMNHQLPGTKRINLEDVEFNKTLKTYSDNELEAFLVLTPDLMFKLKELNKKTKGLKIAMYENKLFMVMNHADLFKFTKDKKNFQSNMFDNFYDDIETIMGIVTEIKKNNKVFKM